MRTRQHTFPYVTCMRISIISKSARFVLPLAAVALMGQSCTIPFFTQNANSTTDGGVFRSDDHGQTWKQHNTITVSGKAAGSLRSTSIRTLAFDPQVQDRLFASTVGNGIYVSTNGGDSWTATSLKSGDYSCLAFQPNDHEVMYTAAGKSILKSVDSGLHWKSVYSEAQPGITVDCVTVSPNEPQTVWGMASGKILRSQDGGKNWSLMVTIPAFIPRLVTFTPDGSSMTIFSRTTGIFVVDLTTMQWQDISKPLKKLPKASNIKSVSVVPGATPLWVMATSYGLIRSVDSGASWQSVSTLNSSAVTIQNVVVNPNDTNEMFITIGNHIQRTADGGNTWTVNSIATARTLVQLSIDPNHVDRMFVGTFYTK